MRPFARVVLTIIVMFIIYRAYMDAKRTNNTSSISSNCTSNKVNVIQTWKTRNVPSKYIECQRKVMNLQDTNYIFFDDEKMYHFVEHSYRRYFDYFMKMKVKIQQIDMFRYLAIHHFGGLYLDLDMDVHISHIDWKHLEPCTFPQELDANTDTILQDKGCDYLLGNYAFYAERNNGFLLELVENIVNNKYNIRVENCENIMQYVYYTTGPVHVTLTYLDSVHEVKVLQSVPFKKFQFGEYASHVMMGSWK